LDLLEKMKMQNDKLLNEALAMFSTAQLNSSKISQKFEKILKFHQILNKRVETVLQILNTRNEGLSPAEKLFHKELEQTKCKMPHYNTKISEVNIYIC
jgi:hypothetical protein